MYCNRLFVLDSKCSARKFKAFALSLTRCYILCEWCQWYSNMSLFHSVINLISDTLAVLYEDRSPFAETIPPIDASLPLTGVRRSIVDHHHNFFSSNSWNSFFFQPIFHSHRLSLHSFGGVKWSKYGLIQMKKK